MKTFKLIFLLFIASILGACDDNDSGAINGGESGDLIASVAVGFEHESVTVLKRSDSVVIKIVLEEIVEHDVKVTIVAMAGDDANSAVEGDDFSLPNKVITIPAGEITSLFTVNLVDNGEVNDDKELVLNIVDVFGGVPSTKRNCSIDLVSASFVEFDKAVWRTYEAATTENKDSATLRVPLKVSGLVSETATIEIAVKNGTAIEGEHFDILSKEIILNKGDKLVYVDISTIDETIVNVDRTFELIVSKVKNGNVSIGNLDTCKISIVSEELVKTFSFGAFSAFMQEGGELEIEVKVDNVVLEGGSPISVNIMAGSGGNAIIGEDYELGSNVLTFEAGEKVKKVTVTSFNDSWFIDREFVLKLESLDGSNVAVGKDEIVVNVRNLDIITIEQSILVEEGHGSYTIPVTIYRPLEDDLVLNISAADIASATKKEKCTLNTDAITITSGQTVANILVTIGNNIEWSEVQIPTFRLEIGDSKNTVPVFGTNVSLTEKDEYKIYRKFLGKWQMSSDEKGASDSQITITAGKDGKLFNSKYSCSVKASDLGGYAGVDGDVFNWTMNFDGATSVIDFPFDDKLATDYTFGKKQTYLQWFQYFDKELDVMSYSTEWDGDNTLKINSGGNTLSIGHFNMTDGSYVGVGSVWYRGNVKLERVVD